MTASPLNLQSNACLRTLNTLGVQASAQAYLRIEDLATLQAVQRDPVLSALPRLVLGGGSNIVLTQDFPGLVLHMCMRGKEVLSRDADASYVRAAAGENWHDFVQWSLEQGLPGLENLSLIPGTVGAAPIQNIGAYGVEVGELLHSVEILDLEDGQVRELDQVECAFAYRDSIFKHDLAGRAVVLAVTFRLPHAWQPRLGYQELYKELQHQGLEQPSPQQISQAVIRVRQRKLPDPAVLGNAGSFFKNPLVSAAQRNQLLEAHPQLLSHDQPDGRYKLAAGWLIDQCGWKGKDAGAAGVYEKQALVLVNRGTASGQDIVHLATLIQRDVAARFGVQLEPEPLFI